MKPFAEFDEKMQPIVDAFTRLREKLEELPASRMKSLAITDLESAFTRAVFAVTEIADPIRMKRG